MKVARTLSVDQSVAVVVVAEISSDDADALDQCRNARDDEAAKARRWDDDDGTKAVDRRSIRALPNTNMAQWRLGVDFNSMETLQSR